MDGFHKISITERNTSKRTCEVWEETDKKIKQLPDLIMCDLEHGPELEKPPRIEKSAIGVIQKLKLENARQLRGIGESM